jgi:hypothetical protein
VPLAGISNDLPQFGSHAFAQHREQIPTRFAGRNPEIVVNWPEEVEGFVFPAYENGGRREGLY